MIHVLCLASQKLFKKTQDLENIINNNSLLEWRWWKVFCNKKPCWRIKIEDLVIIKNLCKSYPLRQKVNTLPKKKGTLWRKNIWLVVFNQELIRMYSKIVISGKSKSRIIFSSLVPQMQKSKLTISLITKTLRLDLAHMIIIRIVLNQKMDEGPTLQVLLPIERTYCSMEIVTLVLKNILINLNHSMLRAGKQILEPSVQLRENLLLSTKSNPPDLLYQVLEVILARACFRKSIKSRKWKDKMWKLKANHKVAFSHQLQLGLLIQNLRKTLDFIGQLLVNMMKREFLVLGLFKEEHQITF